MADWPTLRPSTSELAHLGPLEVDPRLLEARFAPDCATERCNADCCRYGVSLDVAERDRILAHANLVRNFMDPEQACPPADWFSVEDYDGPEFPSGRWARTRVRGGVCVFLDRDRRCVLQRAEQLGPPGERLKPYFCFAYPLVILDGTLSLDGAAAPDRAACCAPISDGTRTVFEACSVELGFVLGPAGLDELRRVVEGRG